MGLLVSDWNSIDFLRDHNFQDPDHRNQSSGNRIQDKSFLLANVPTIYEHQDSPTFYLRLENQRRFYQLWDYWRTSGEPNHSPDLYFHADGRRDCNSAASYPSNPDFPFNSGCLPDSNPKPSKQVSGDHKNTENILVCQYHFQRDRWVCYMFG